MDDNRPVVTEREVLVELIEQYRDLPGLWDPHHEHYCNKEARQVAYESLLACYHKFDKKASVGVLKKKLENMRTSYKREKKKVEKSMADESRTTVHVPTLWYYPYFSFLDDDSDQTLKVENDNDSDNKSDEPERKRSKPISKGSVDNLLKKQIDLIDTAQTFLTSPAEDSSADAFGKSISSQLKELPKLQRCLAEKLIGEVMFYAKLDQLNMDTVVYLNDGDFEGS